MYSMFDRSLMFWVNWTTVDTIQLTVTGAKIMATADEKN